MKMIKFHPKHPSFTNILMQIVCLAMIVWTGYKFGGESVLSLVLSLGLAILLSFDVIEQLIYYRNPKPNVLVFDDGIVANYRLLEWKCIDRVSLIPERDQIGVHLLNGELVKIHLGNMRESSGEFLAAVQSFKDDLVEQTIPTKSIA